MHPYEIALISDQNTSKLCFSKVMSELFMSKGLQDEKQQANKTSSFTAGFAKSKSEFLYCKPGKSADDSMITAKE